MKKTFKLLAVLIITVVFFAACGKGNEEQNLLQLYDLNNNGVIDFWETPFEKESVSTRGTHKDQVVKSITTTDEFLQIDTAVNDELIVYKLENNLDFKDVEITKPINFGKAMLYGNNKTLSNFNIQGTDMSMGYALIYNATAVFDTKFYMGIHTNTLESGVLSYDTISLMNKVEEVDNVKVRGAYDLSDYEGSLRVAFLLANSPDSVISNVVIEGEIKAKIQKESSTGRFTFGGAIDDLGENGSITNVTTKIIADIESYNANTIGGIAAISQGFIEDTYSQLDMDLILENAVKTSTGGVAGKLDQNGEIKHSVADIDFKIATLSEFERRHGAIAAGGLVGESYGSLFYNEAKGTMEVTNVTDAVIGGMIGASSNTYALRNISKVNINVSYPTKAPENMPTLYVSGFSGNAVGGVLESCISVGSINVDANRESFNALAENINIGLMFFHSSYFKDFTSGAKHEDLVSNDTYVLNESSNKKTKFPNLSPVLNKNIIQGKISLNSENIDLDNKNAYDSVNFGGYWWWVRSNDITVVPEGFLSSLSSSYNSSIVLDGKDQTSQFMPDRNWLSQATITAHNLGLRYGILDTESKVENNSIASLTFINTPDLKGSYYKSLAVIGVNNSRAYDLHATSIEQLKYLASYLQNKYDPSPENSSNKNMLTFEVNKQQITKPENYIGQIEVIKSELVFAYEEVEGEDEQVLHAFSKSAWAIENSNSDYNEVSITEIAELLDLTHDVQYILIHEILTVAGRAEISFETNKHYGSDGEVIDTDSTNIIYFTYARSQTTASHQVFGLNLKNVNDTNIDRYTIFYSMQG